MWLSTLLLAGSLSSGIAIPIQGNIPQACFIYGEVFFSANQVTAVLSSNCPISIERKERRVIMKGPHRVAHFMIPEIPGVHEFIYRWGNRIARFDDEEIEVALGGGGEL
jgi:hypothetical protein